MRSFFGLLPCCSLLWLHGLGASAGAAGTEAAGGGVPGARSRFAKLGPNKVHYVALGKGPPTLVFVHCWAGNLDFWRAQVPAFQGRARVILVDLPGHGKSDAPQGACAIPGYARAIEAVLRDAKVDKAVLVGHSMGVGVVNRFYRDFPAKTQALVAVDGSLRGYDLTRVQFDEWIKPFRGPDYRETVARFIDTMFPMAGTEALRERDKAAMLRTPQHVMVSSLEGLFERADWECRRIGVPVLVINAPNPIWTTDYEAYVRELAPLLDYRKIPDTGHFLMQEKPEEFNTALLEFLGKHQLLKKSSHTKSSP